MDATSMGPEIFFKIWRHWATRLSLASSGVRIRGPVVILPSTFTIFLGKKSHQLLVLSNKLLQNFCSYCCSWWWRIFRGGRYLPCYPGVEIWRKGGLQYIKQGWLVRSQIVLGSILQSWWVLDGFHKKISWMRSTFY